MKRLALCIALLTGCGPDKAYLDACAAFTAEKAAYESVVDEVKELDDGIKAIQSYEAQDRLRAQMKPLYQKRADSKERMEQARMKMESLNP